ncbi:MAG: MFS transporter, partial [Chlamydiota bacterium]|nr:MFS transporter [Chlamydiota bacterium]
MTLRYWRYLIPAILFFGYELLQLHVMGAIAPLCMEEMGWSATDTGHISASYLVADLLFLLPMGWLLDRYPMKPTLLIAGLLCVGGVFYFGRADSVWEATVAHALSGIGNAACFLTCMSLVHQWVPRHRRNLVIGTMITMGMLGGILGQHPLIAIADGFGWRRALLVDGLLGLLILLAILFFLKENRGSKGEVKE